MPLFLCRLPNGDSSALLAPTRDDALIELDQVGNAEGYPLAELRTFQTHFALTDQGGLALESFGEGTKVELLAFAYPVLERALDEAYGDDGREGFESLPPDRQAAIATAVKQERSRVAADEAATTDPQTNLGSELKGQTDLPTVLIDRLVHHRTTKSLKRFKGRGKPSKGTDSWRQVVTPSSTSRGARACRCMKDRSGASDSTRQRDRSRPAGHKPSKRPVIGIDLRLPATSTSSYPSRRRDRSADLL
jgi:hypothetical protein